MASTGGQLLFEHRNLQKKGRQLSASVTAQNFLQPAEDLGFRLDYKMPNLYGIQDPRRSALVVSAFNARKLSGVFIPGGSLRRAERQALHILCSHLCQCYGSLCHDHGMVLKLLLHSVHCLHAHAFHVESCRLIYLRCRFRSVPCQCIIACVFQS